MIVELAGAPGAGKSALQPEVVRELRSLGFSAQAADTAVMECLDRSRLARAVAPLGRSQPARLRSIAVDAADGMAVLLTRPALTGRVLLSVLRSPVGGGHRALLARRFLVVAARERFLRRLLRSGEAVVIDEGLLHRVVNVFAWRERVTEREVRAYVAGIRPLPHLILLLEVRPDVARRRLSERGLPARLRGLPPAAADGFLARAAWALDVAADEAVRRGATVLRIATDEGLEQVQARLAEAVRAAVPAIDATTPRYVPSLPFEVPRPDRALGRRRAQRRPVTFPLEAVLAELGLRPAGRIRRLAAGRSDVVAVDTHRGEVVVKRYRDAVDEGAIAGEHSVLRELAAQRFPSPRLIEAAGGETLVRHPSGRYAAFVALTGYRPLHTLTALPGTSRRLAGDAGRTLATLHARLRGFVPAGANPDGLAGWDGPRIRPIEWYVERLRAGAQPDGPDSAVLERAARRLVRVEAIVQDSAPRSAVIHGDYGPYNLLVRPGDQIVVSDFELTRIDWLLTDLATALPRFAASRVGFSGRRAKAFLAGYAAYGDLSEEERRLIPIVLEYLSLRRAAVCLGRLQSNGEERWLAEARARLRLAHSLAAGSHPLARLALDR
ncbi:MAG TPA: phosphotransferase [candidate division Zixibacteria bacterium]|nr:phosphotransferase [candidate division Zixibacteria bacterium]